MARAKHNDCPLCPPALDRDKHDRVYYEYQETRAFAAAAVKASELGSQTNEEQARAHFQYHRIIQPPPRGYLKRNRALEHAQALPARLQNILVLVSRVRALSATDLAELFYWNGSEAQLASARNACYRDLRRLILDDFVFRYYPPMVARPPAGSHARARQEQLTLYFLGRDAGPYIEEREQMELARRDFVSEIKDIADESKVMQQHETAATVVALARQVKLLEVSGRRPESGVEGAPPLALSFAPANWFGRERVSTTFRDPLSGLEESVSPSGFTAIGLSAPEQNFSVLAPFFYEYDVGAKTLSAYAEELLGYLYLSRAGALADLFPQLPRRDYFPPVIVVCREMSRVIALQEEMRRLRHQRALTSDRMPVIIITDEVTNKYHGLAGQSWLSLWDHSLEGRRYRLTEVLLRSCAPLLNVLSADAILLAQQPKSG
jgi:hypothetical protein